MHTSKTILVLTAVSLLAGCCVFERKQVDYKTGVVDVATLEVPPDMTVLATEARYTMPANDGTQVARFSDFKRDPSALQAASAPVTEATAADNATPARMLEVGGTRFILLNEPFDRSWRRVGLALEQAKISVGDVDRSKGIYFIKSADKNAKADELQVLLHEANGLTDVTVKDHGNLNGKESARMLDVLMQNLGK